MWYRQNSKLLACDLHLSDWAPICLKTNKLLLACSDNETKGTQIIQNLNPGDGILSPAFRWQGGDSQNRQGPNSATWSDV